MEQQANHPPMTVLQNNKGTGVDLIYDRSFGDSIETVTEHYQDGVLIALDRNFGLVIIESHAGAIACFAITIVRGFRAHGSEVTLDAPKEEGGNVEEAA